MNAWEIVEQKIKNLFSFYSVDIKKPPEKVAF